MLLEVQLVPEANSVSPCVSIPGCEDHGQRCRAGFLEAEKNGLSFPGVNGVFQEVDFEKHGPTGHGLCEIEIN